MWRGCRRSAGCRSRRSVLVGSSEPARTSDGESTRLSGPVAGEAPGGGQRADRRGRVPTAVCGWRAVHAQQTRPPAEARAQRSRAAPACRRRRGRRSRRARCPRASARASRRARRAGSPRRRGRRTRRRAGRGRARAGVASSRRRAGARAGSRAGRSSRRRARRSRSQLDHLRGALADRVQVARGDHQQRDAVDAVIVEPVADHRAALERRRLDVVQGDGDRAWRWVERMPSTARAQAARLPAPTGRSSRVAACARRSPSTRS